MDIQWPAVWQWLASSGLKLLGVAVGAWLAVFLVNRLIRMITRRMIDRAANRQKVEASKRMQTAESLFQTLTLVVVLLIALLVALGELGINLAPLLATAGIAGVALGFGAQHLVKDVISGLFILLENQFNVGDVVQVAGLSGVVEKTNLRVTVLRDLEGRVHYVPNGQITTTTNYTKEWSRALLDIGVAYKEDTDEVVRVMKEVAGELEKDEVFGPKILTPLEVLGVNNFGDSAVDIRVTFKTRTMEQWAVAREFRRRLKKAFDARGIEIPFPHRTLYVGGDQPGGRLAVDVRNSTPEGEDGDREK